MTPVMERCHCPAAYPIAECCTCTPTPPDGLHPDHGQPIEPPTPHTPDDDPDGLTQPPTATYILAVSAVAIIAGWAAVGVAVWGAWKLGAWAVGLLA